MIGINHIPHRYGNSVAMVTKRYLNNSFVLSPIGSIFDMEVFRMISISHIPCHHGNSVFLEAKEKPGNKQHPGSLSVLKDLFTKYDTRRASNGKVTSICPCCHGYNISILTSKPFHEIPLKLYVCQT